MRWAKFGGNTGYLMVAITSFVLSPRAHGQSGGQEKAVASAPRADGPATVQESIQQIDEAFNRQLVQLEQRRLGELATLAEQQKPAEAAPILERLFRLAIAADMFREAEAVAGKVVEKGTPSPTTDALAHLVKIIAEADRGAFEQSLQSLRQAVAESTQVRPATPARALAAEEVVGICEAYYQRLVEANQFAIAGKAFQLILEQPYSPLLKDFAANRLKRIELVGKPAPSIRSIDLDGKPFDLAAEKGKGVLLYFWATWSLPAASQVAWFQQVQETYHKRGLEVVGICLDTPADAQKPETVLPGIRQFLLDHNVPWPTLLNGPADLDFAKAYGIADIPANVLIGRDGTVVQIDLSRRNLETAVSRVLGP